jgi:hypothetical protein
MTTEKCRIATNRILQRQEEILALQYLSMTQGAKRLLREFIANFFRFSPFSMCAYFPDLLMLGYDA